MDTFRTKLNGYDKKQVDDYILGLSSQFEKSNAQLRERIKLLENENDTLYRDLCNYRRKEESISTALMNAIDKAKEIDYASKVRFALEGERLKDFSRKWTSYCRNQVNKVAPKQAAATNAFLGEMKKSLEEVMGQQLNLGAYVNEATIEHENEKTRLERTDSGSVKTA